MSLVNQISDLTVRQGTESKAIRTVIGALSALSTSNKSSVVAALNELAGSIGGAGATINDTTPSTTAVYSSSKTESVATAKAAALIDDSAASGTTAYSSNKVVAVSNAAAVASALALINDLGVSTTKVYSSQKTSDAIAAAVAASVTSLVDSSPTTLDTLKELSDALGADANFAATMATALGNRVRFDAGQTLSAPQKVQANANIGSLSLVNAGDITTDFVAIFNTAIA